MQGNIAVSRILPVTRRNGFGFRLIVRIFFQHSENPPGMRKIYSLNSEKARHSYQHSPKEKYDDSGMLEANVP